MAGADIFSGRLGLQQRVLPTYRVAFFEHLARACSGQMSLYAGSPRPNEGIHPADGLRIGQYHHSHNLHLFKGPYYLCWQLDLMSWLRGWDPDALIMEANPRYPASRNAIAWMHANKRPVLGWGLGASAGNGILGGIRDSFRRKFLHRFDVLIAYSEQGAEEYSALGYPQDRIIVAPNAVALPPKRSPERAPLEGRSPRLIFVGRLQARKRVDLLLRACAQLVPPPELVIVGQGPERIALEALADQVFPRAVFTGALFDQQLEHELARADLFVLPGTGGLAVQQAMAAGLPVIVAEGDGTQNDLVSGDNGWLIPADDIEALVGALRSALRDPIRMREMGTASFNLAATRFNIDAMRDRFLEALTLASEVV